MTQRIYKIVDVFSSTPLRGNPLAVVLDAEGLDAAAMQGIARWFNLSETTFLLPSSDAQSDYRLRIFTPYRELPFAGHPTLGSAHAALESGRVTLHDNRLIQDCGVGQVRIDARQDGPNRILSFSLPPARVTPLTAADVAELETILGTAVDHDAWPAIIDVGAIWIVARIRSVESLLALQPDFTRSIEFERRLGVTGVSVFADHAAGPLSSAIEVRSFAPSCGVNEDPVCGSGNGSIAVFRKLRGLIAHSAVRYDAFQGRCVDRDGRVLIRVDDQDQVWVGGSCVTSAEGVLRV